MKCVCFSDNHGQKVPVQPASGDVLIVAGDITSYGTLAQTVEALDLLADLKFPRTLLVPGNHDRMFESDPGKARELCLDRGITLLIDEEVSIERIKFYGSPWQPAFCNWAFNLPSPGSISTKWSRIPQDTDVLITHGPIYGVLDQTSPVGAPLGCRELRSRMHQLRLKYHIFGHIHGGYGSSPVSLAQHDYVAVNVSCCDEAYAVVNPPVILTL